MSTEVPPLLSPRGNRLLCAIIPIGPKPVAVENQDLTARRVARVLAHHPKLQIFHCPWTQLSFPDDGAVFCTGPVVEQTRTELVPATLAEPTRPDVMLYFPTGGTARPGTTAAEASAMRRFAELEIGNHGENRFGLVRRLLVEASRRGVLSNATAADGSWGLKDSLEKHLAAYEEATSSRIARPRTWAVKGPDVAAKVAELARQGVDTIIKPHAGLGGNNVLVRLASSSEPLPPGIGMSVVQELLADPLLVRGYKCDLRCYALVDTASRQRSYRPQTVLVRLAAAPYQRGKLEAEVTNTALRRRMKLPPATYPLDRVDSIKMETRAALEKALERATEQVIDAYFWWAAHKAPAVPPTASNRLLLWGFDFFVSDRAGKLELSLLEVNIYPDLIPNVAICEPSIEAMIAEDFAQGVIRAKKSGEAARATALRDAATITTAATEIGATAAAGSSAAAVLPAPPVKPAPKRLPPLPGADGKPTLVVLSLGPRPVTTTTHDAQLLHIAKAFTSGARVVIARWPQLYFDAVPLIEGPVQHLGPDGAPTTVLAQPLAMDGMVFFPTSHAGRLTNPFADETAAIQRFASQKIDTSANNRYALVGGLLSEVAKRGVPSNAAGRSGFWGYKDQLDKMLRAFSDATAKVVHRPQTWSAAPADVPVILGNLARRGIDCIIKGNNAARAEGIEIRLAKKGEPPPAKLGAITVIQELVPEPLLVDGHKVDFRCYAIIDTGDRKASFRPRATLVRLAGVPYERGRPESEITNTSFLKRKGLPSSTFPLDEMPAIDARLRGQIHDGLDELVASFLDGYFHWKDSPANTKLNRGTTLRRVFVWGLDVVASTSARAHDGGDGKLSFYLLESNVYPHLLPNVKSCEPGIFAMLERDYLPRLFAARTQR